MTTLLVAASDTSTPPPYMLLATHDVSALLFHVMCELDIKDPTLIATHPPDVDAVEFTNTLFVRINELDVTVDDESTATDPPFELDALFVK